jgi:hypothetical protein
MSDELDCLTALIENEGVAYTALFKVSSSVFSAAGAEQEAKALVDAYDALIEKLKAAGMDV